MITAYKMIAVRNPLYDTWNRYKLTGSGNNSMIFHCSTGDLVRANQDEMDWAAFCAEWVTQGYEVYEILPACLAAAGGGE